MVLIAWLIGCEGGKEPAAEPDTAACAGCGEDTAPPDSDAPPDTAPAETGDSAPDTADTALDTAEPCASATFIGEDGSVLDLTAVFTSGDYYTVAEPGALEFCPGEWYVRLIVRADLSIVGLGEAREDTVLSGGEQGTVISATGSLDLPTAVSITNVTIDRGSALANVGGASVNGGGIHCRNVADFTLQDVLLSNNKGVDGGGLYAHDCVTTVIDSDFVGNIGQDDGGAVSLYEGEATFQGALFQGNTGADGAAILDYYAPVSIVDSVFQENHATSTGGALTSYYGEIAVESSIFLDNVSDFYGGAGALFGAATFTGCLFQGNSVALAIGDGGAIFRSTDHIIAGEGCDFVANDPNDICDYYGNGPLVLGKGASFLCDAEGCVQN